MSEKIICNVSSYKRPETLLKTIDSVYNQCDIINISLNDYDEIPEELYDDKINIILTNNEKGDAYKLKIDLMEFVNGYHVIISTLITEIYGEDGYEWYYWFCYENNYGQGILTANEADGTPICYSHKSLWEYLEKNHLIINK